MSHAYETCLPLDLSGILVRIRDCCAAYPSHADLQLEANESTIQKGVHSIPVSLSHSLGHLRRNDAPADFQ